MGEINGNLISASAVRPKGLRTPYTAVDPQTYHPMVEHPSPPNPDFNVGRERWALKFFWPTPLGHPKI